MFEPEAEYHVRSLDKFGVPKLKIPTILHHPYTENIPFDKDLPKMNIFTLNVKSLDRTDLQFLAETNENKPSIQIIERILIQLKKYEGIHHLSFYSENETEDMEKDLKSKIRFRSLDSTKGFSKNKLGTAKQGTDILTYLEPFMDKDYFITPEDCSLNLDIVKIMNDQEHYHSFIFKYLKDERKKLFVILHLLLSIYENKDKMKYGVVLYIPELSALIGTKETGFASYLAELIAKTMRLMRASNISIVTDSQSWKYSSSSVLSAINDFFIGKIVSMDELESVKTKLGLKAKEFELLKSLEIGQFLMITKDEGLDETSCQKIIGFLPPHAHKEVYQKFSELYIKNGYELIKHIEVKNIMDKIKNDIIKDVLKLVEEENRNKLKRMRNIEEGKEAKIKAKLEAETNKVIKKQEQQKEFDLSTARIWRDLYENEHQSTRKIAEKYNTNHTAVLRAINDLKEIEEKEKNTPKSEHPQQQTNPS